MSKVVDFETRRPKHQNGTGAALPGGTEAQVGPGKLLDMTAHKQRRAGAVRRKFPPVRWADLNPWERHIYETAWFTGSHDETAFIKRRLSYLLEASTDDLAKYLALADYAEQLKQEQRKVQLFSPDEATDEQSARAINYMNTTGLGQGLPDEILELLRVLLYYRLQESYEDYSPATPR